MSIETKRLSKFVTENLQKFQLLQDNMHNISMYNSNNEVKENNYHNDLIQKKSLKNYRFFAKKIISSKPITNSIKRFLGENQLVQLMDETNCLSEVTQKRKICSFGPGGLDNKRASVSVREIHPSHFGRICPIETPEGQNAGLVNSLAIQARVNQYGFIETPFYKIENLQIKEKKGVFFLSSQQEEEMAIAVHDIFSSFKQNRKMLRKNVSIKINQEFTVRHIMTKSLFYKI